MSNTQPFNPDYGQNLVLTGTGSAQNATVRRTAKQINFVNSGTAKAYVRLYDSRETVGSNAATVADFCIPAGLSRTVSKSTHHDTVSYIGAGAILDMITGEGW